VCKGNDQKFGANDTCKFARDKKRIFLAFEIVKSAKEIERENGYLLVAN